MANTNRESTAQPPATHSTRKRLAFGLITLSLPVLLFGLAELVLRLCGFGGYAPFFRKVGEVPGGSLVLADQAGAISYFFANQDRPGYNEQYSFLDPKPANTVRIFLVGESAIKGYPQPRHLASSAFLQAMLQDAWPERVVETINLGTTAIASYPVLGIATEALAYEPDLIVVSTGHNEFFGTYGVASSGRAGGKPWMLAANRFVHSLALVQGLARLVASSEPSGENLTLMERMVGSAYVASDDWRRAAAANNLNHNVREIILRCQARGVPVIVCTQPSNERDLAPVGRPSADALPGTSAGELQSLFTLAETRLPDDPGLAIAPLKRILELHPPNARAHFLLGKAFAAQGRPSEALTEFNHARDLDTMPWRTPSLLQEAILRAAREGHAPVCDLVQVFRDASPGGAIGWDLMEDHVHPTLHGQALIAEGILNLLTGREDRLQVTSEMRARVKPWPEYAKQLGDNPYDRHGVAHQMRLLFDVPFMRESNPEALRRFTVLVEQGESGFDPEVLAAVREWQTLRPHAGARRPITGMVARVRMRQGNLTEALELFEIARKAVPEYTSWHMEYVYFALACKEKLHGALTEADRALALHELEQGRFLLRRGFSESGFTERYTGRLHQLRGEFAEAIPFLNASRTKLTGMELVAAEQALLVSLIKTGQYDEAQALARYGAEHALQYAPLYRNMLTEVEAMRTTNQPGQGTTLTR